MDHNMINTALLRKQIACLVRLSQHKAVSKTDKEHLQGVISFLESVLQEAEGPAASITIRVKE